jgi:AcrR family transcriptional regulator
MVDKDTGTEEKILAAAKTVFLRKGYYGARMQEIADEAGINKALLHYYYRSKDRLFEVIFLQAFRKFFPLVYDILSGPGSLIEKITHFVDHYIDLLQENPYLPQFILSEVSRNPENLPRLFFSAGLDPASYLEKVKALGKEEFPEGFDVRHFIVNLLSMCIFPIAARPLISRVMFEGDESAYERFLGERKAVVAEAVLRMVSQRPDTTNASPSL